MVLLLFQHRFLPTSMWRPIICTRDLMLLEYHLLSQVAHAAFSPLGSFQRWTCWYLLVPPNASIITYWNLHYPWELLGLNAFNHPWMFQVSYVFPTPALGPLVLSKCLGEHVKGQLRHLILVAPCLIEAPWLPTVLNMLADVPW